MSERCFACDRPLRGKPRVVRVQGEETTAFVGPDCFAKVSRAGEHGYQPPLGGPRLILAEEVKS